MAQKPLISIITVCYNIKDEIERTCESIISQTNPNYEWIVVDGDSTDGTVDILNKYKDKMSVFISEKDTGIYNAMNKGIKRATGEWCIFMNGGDCFASNNIIEKFSQLDGIYEYADVIYGDVDFINQNEKRKTINYPYPLTKSYFHNGNTINHQSTFIKKELFKKYGCYNENYRIVSDWEKWIIFFVNGCKFIKWDIVIANFYRGGISSTQIEKIQSELTEINKKYFIYHETINKFYQGQKIIFLFNKIPLFSIKKKMFPYKINIKLFKFIPLFSCKRNRNNYKINLIGIPFLETKNRKNNKIRIYFIFKLPILKEIRKTN